jgi:hypothetical protein
MNEPVNQLVDWFIQSQPTSSLATDSKSWTSTVLEVSSSRSTFPINLWQNKNFVKWEIRPSKAIRNSR